MHAWGRLPYIGANAAIVGVGVGVEVAVGVAAVVVGGGVAFIGGGGFNCGSFSQKRLGGDSNYRSSSTNA